MSENTKESESKTKSINTPTAIIIAGVVIALAVWFRPAAEPAVPGLPEGGGPLAAPEAPAVGDFRPVDDTDHLTGNPNAKLTLIEYSDLECPFCQRFHPTVAQALEEYPDDINWVYRHYPLPIHPGATPKALATECAAEQGKFWEFTNALFEAGTDYPVADLGTLAETVGVANASQFATCLESEKYADKVSAQAKDAQTAGGRGTPYTLVVNADGEATPINGALPYEVVKQTIEEAL